MKLYPGNISKCKYKPGDIITNLYIQSLILIDRDIETQKSISEKYYRLSDRESLKNALWEIKEINECIREVNGSIYNILIQQGRILRHLHWYQWVPNLTYYNGKHAMTLQLVSFTCINDKGVAYKGKVIGDYKVVKIVEE